MDELKNTLPKDFQPRNTDGAALKSLIRDLNNQMITGADVPVGVDPIQEVDIARKVKAASLAQQAQAQAETLAATNALPGLPGSIETIADPNSILVDGPAVIGGSAQAVDFLAPEIKGAKLCFTGRTHVGKDFVATQLGAKIFGFADPLYDVLEYFFGTRQRDLPGAREFLQKLGQWGRGEISAAYPLTPERAGFTMWIRAASAEGKLPAYVNWNDYGFNENIWLDACLSRVNAYVAENPSQRIAISNVRFQNELKRLTAEGFIHTHVICSPATWNQRLAKDKIESNAPLLTDMSERLAHTIDANVVRQLSSRQGGKLRCVWNDTVKVPSPRLMSLPELNAEIKTLESKV